MHSNLYSGCSNKMLGSKSRNQRGLRKETARLFGMYRKLLPHGANCTLEKLWGQTKIISLKTQRDKLCGQSASFINVIPTEQRRIFVSQYQMFACLRLQHTVKKPLKRGGVYLGFISGQYYRLKPASYLLFRKRAGISFIWCI